MFNIFLILALIHTMRFFMRFDSSKSHDKTHPIAGNGTVYIATTYVAATLKKVPALLPPPPISLRLTSRNEI